MLEIHTVYRLLPRIFIPRREKVYIERDQQYLYFWITYILLNMADSEALSPHTDTAQVSGFKRKYPSDEHDQRKARLEKWKKNKNTRKGKLEFSFCKDEEKEELFEKVRTVKGILGEGQPTAITTFHMLQRVLDFYISNSCEKGVATKGARNDSCNKKQPSPEFQLVDEEKSLDEKLFVGAVSSLHSLVNQMQHHCEICDHAVTIAKENRIRHVVQAELNCKAGHKFSWTSSPHVKGGKFLVNLRLAHGYLSSGILPNQYLRLCETSDIGVMGSSYLDQLVSDIDTGYYTTVKNMATESMSDALLQEIAAQEWVDPVRGGINILTDARHCWRKNAKFSDVVCLGNLTHQVLQVETVTKDDDKVSQRHELLGIKKIYTNFDSQDVPIITHAHDNNASVTKFVREEREPTENAKDTWHVTKTITKEARKVTTGSLANEGKLWHPELSDKAASIRTHIYYSMKNCHGDANKLKASIDNTVEHYKGHHEKCSPESRCHKDAPFYVPSKTRITDPVAENMLTHFLHKLPVYKDAEHYKYCMDTHYVESFNNALLQYHDKRIVFGLNNYNLRLNLAILDWNEHVDRQATSEKQEEDSSKPRRQAYVKVLSKKTYNFRQSIWKQWMERMYKVNTTNTHAE